MKMNKSHEAEIVAYVGDVPEHIKAIAGAIRYDLLYGPTYARIPQGDVTKFTADDCATLYEDLEKGEGDIIEETYVGQLAQALRNYLDTLPSVFYVGEYTECVSETEPEGFEDECGSWCDPEPYYAYDSAAIREAIFGKLIAKEFN